MIYRVSQKLRTKKIFEENFSPKFFIKVPDMTARLSIDDKVELIFMCGVPGATNRSVAEAFNRLNPDRSPAHQVTVGRLIKRFKDTGSVADRPRSGRRRSATSEEMSAAVLAHLRSTPKKSTRKLSQETGPSQTSVMRILHSNHFHPYKVHLVQDLHGDDTDRRRKFCEWMHQNIILSILFSDEAIFYLSGNVNRHNFRYWSDTNPRWMEATRVQVDPRVMVWAGIFEDQIIGPFFFDGNVTQDSYLDMLQSYLEDFLNDIPPPQRSSVFFQQDGAPPHFATIVRNYLHEQFPGRWIGRLGPIEWPPRSPDLNPLDFFLWGPLKSVVYRNRPRNIDELKEAIRQEIHNIPRETLLR
jgi:transposase